MQTKQERERERKRERSWLIYFTPTFIFTGSVCTLLAMDSIFGTIVAEKREILAFVLSHSAIILSTYPQQECGRERRAEK